MNDILITLKGLLSVIESVKPVTINLYDKDSELLIISFELKGYNALDDFLEDDEVTKIVIKNLYNIDVYIDTSLNA